MHQSILYNTDSHIPPCRYIADIPVLGEHINCRRVVGAVTDIESLHLWHEVEEEAADPLLGFRKPKAGKAHLCEW